MTIKADLSSKIIFLNNGSEVKDKIFKLIQEKGKISISEINKLIIDSKGKKYNYRTIWQHIKSLEKFGVVRLEKQEHLPGKPIIVKDLTDEIFEKNYKKIEEEYKIQQNNPNNSTTPQPA